MGEMVAGPVLNALVAEKMGDDLGHVHDWVAVTAPDDGYGESHGWICRICEPNGYRGSMRLNDPTDPVFADRMREVRRTPRPYSTDIAATRLVLDEIARRYDPDDLNGVPQRFMVALAHSVGFNGFSCLGWMDLFRYVHATPEQICLAALKALEVSV